MLETLLDGSTYVFCLPCLKEAREAFYADLYHNPEARDEKNSQTLGADR